MMFKSKIYTTIIGLFISFLLLTSCDDKPMSSISDGLLSSIPKNIKFIGHKGSGTINKNGNINLHENTWEAIVNAMELIDGSEIDIQLSADSTFWIFHNHTLFNCDSVEANFSTITDEDLITISNCNYDSSFMKLSDFLLKAKLEDWEDKLLCLDLKVLFNPHTENLFEDYPTQASFVRDKLNRLIKESKIETRIIFEVFTIQQYKIFDSVFKGQTYFVNLFPSKESMLVNNRENIKLSLPLYNLPKDMDTSIIKSENLWTINTADQFIKALSIGPKIMQSDNIPMMSFFKSLQQGRNIIETVVLDSILKTKDGEFNHLMMLDLPLKNNQLVVFEGLNKVFPEEVFFVLKGIDEKDSSIHWRGLDLSDNPKPYYFLDSEYLMHIKAKKIRLSIWNKVQSELNHRYKVSLYRLQD